MSITDSVLGTEESTWHISGHAGDGITIKQMPLKPLPFVVGRQPHHSLCLPLGTISGSHAEFFQDGNALMLRDLSSTNGTFVNGHRITEAIIQCNDLVQFAELAFRVGRGSSDVGKATVNRDVADSALNLIRFDLLMTDQLFQPHYQPIIDLPTSEIIGWEALGRSGVFGLESPGAMFAAAASLNMADALSRELRLKALEVSLEIGSPPPHVFINTHPAELSTTELVESLLELRKISPEQQVTLEIHEGFCTSTSQMQDLRRELDQLKMSLAYDDFGAGQARLRELVEVPPDYLKFDMGLVRGIDQGSESHRQLVGTLVQMASELNIVTIAEGIETNEEAEVCRELGFDLAQGYLFGRPMPADDAARICRGETESDDR